MTEQQTQRRGIAAMLDAIAQGGSIPVTMVVQAHPDDEVIALGSRLRSLQSAIFVHVTDGAPRDGVDASVHGFAGAHLYARARRRELEAAMALVGVGIEQLREISCPDQQASQCLVALSRQVAGLIGRVRPELLITHPYEGGHPDHDATAFVVHAACALLASQGLPVPELAEASSYHNSPSGIEPYCFIPPNTGASWGGQVTIRLSEEDRELKRRMLACFPTQQETLKYFPVAIECLRPAPRYDFTRPPHQDVLFYERFSWGMTGAQFTTLAQQAVTELGLEGDL